MAKRWGDPYGTFPDVDFLFEDFQRRMNRLFSEFFEVGRWPEGYGWRGTTWPLVNLYDEGKDLVLHAEVPGLSDKDVKITGNSETVTISGERRTMEPEGYSVHRQERGAVTFTRSFALPTKVDLEKSTAVVKNGILTVTLPKVPEAQPRQITVKAG